MELNGTGIGSMLFTEVWNMSLARRTMDGELQAAARLLELLPEDPAGAGGNAAAASGISGSVPAVPKGEYIDVYA